MMSNEEKAEIQERCDNASPAPWHVLYLNCPNRAVIESEGRRMYANEYTVFSAHEYEGYKEDAEFIAHARQDIPRLLDENERLTSELAQAKKERDEALRWVIDKCANCANNTTCNHEKAEGWQRNYKTCEDWQWRGAADGEDVNGLEQNEN